MAQALAPPPWLEESAQAARLALDQEFKGSLVSCPCFPVSRRGPVLQKEFRSLLEPEVVDSIYLIGGFKGSWN